MLMDLLKYFVSQLVDKPEQIIVSKTQFDSKLVVEILVAPKDLSKVIGKNGRVFKSLKVLANVVDPESNVDLVVDVVS